MHGGIHTESYELECLGMRGSPNSAFDSVRFERGSSLKTSNRAPTYPAQSNPPSAGIAAPRLTSVNNRLCTQPSIVSMAPGIEPATAHPIRTDQPPDLTGAVAIAPQHTQHGGAGADSSSAHTNQSLHPHAPDAGRFLRHPENSDSSNNSYWNNTSANNNMTNITHPTTDDMTADHWNATASNSGSKYPRLGETGKRSSRHLMFAVEILVFSIVGWGWLAIREYMGAPPVMDISVLIGLLVSAVINMAMALLYYTADQFENAARGFFSHVLSIWVLYLYSLIESMTEAWGPLCCGGESTYSVARTYSAAYFGGLQFHQAFGAVTLSFISVFLVLAAGQVKACVQDTRAWLLRQAGVSLVCLVSIHVGLFAVRAGVCSGRSTGQFGIALAILAWIFMSDVLPFVISRLRPLVDESKRLIQAMLELVFILLMMALSLVLSLSLGGRPSLVLSLLFLGICIWQASFIIFYLWAIRFRTQTQNQTSAQNRALSNEASAWGRGNVSNNSLGSGFRAFHARPVMFIPEIREMRLHEARRRSALTKAW